MSSFIAIVAGFVLLVWTADRFVNGSAAIARNLGVAPLIIGLTIVAFGTSAPEIFVSAVAAWNGAPGMAVGNALGSNIANVGLILGITAMVVPLSVRSETLRREFPILFAVMLLSLMLVLDGSLDFIDGFILFAALGLMIYWMVNLGLRSRRTDPIASEYEAELPDTMPMKQAIIWFVIGLVGLVVSSRILVWGAVNIAQALGVSDLVIGLTIVAIGTSLPELAASVMSALKKEHDIAIGNVLGSNMYNLLAVMGMPALISPTPLPEQVLLRDFPVMIAMTVALFAMAYGFRGPGRLNRFEGFALIAAFFSYQATIIFSSMA
ncbi:MAG: calcium/sodium antiporter [Gammaproteobacteria bacterium]|nr:calcium/sodium antiporter [Gammaproteobacteria bacterium]